MTSKRRISGAAVVALLLLPLTLPTSASPADDARSRATAIARQRQQITVEAERVNERRLATVLELDQLNRNADELQVRLAVTDQSMQNLSGQAKDAAIQAYVTGADASGIASVVQATSANEIPVREGYTGALLSSAQDVVDQIRSARQDTQQAGRQLNALIDQKNGLQTSLDAGQVRLTKAEAQLADLAKRTDAEIVTLVQQEQERLAQEAADKAAAKALIATPAAVTAASPPALAVKAAPAAGARVPSAPKPSATAAAAPTTKPTTHPPRNRPPSPLPNPPPNQRPSLLPLGLRRLRLRWIRCLARSRILQQPRQTNPRRTAMPSQRFPRRRRRPRKLLVRTTRRRPPAQRLRWPKRSVSWASPMCSAPPGRIRSIVPGSRSGRGARPAC